ncbi:MAG: hypothetical protein MUE72_02335 [Chitinophagaceae bacterium]|nr:hypothetical protein [Chitinophagaceae bacterium]
MSKEQFDKHTDFLARKAAEEYGIAYTEEAWDKMELLLNKEKKKRPIIIWWMLMGAMLLLVGASILNNNITLSNNYQQVTSENIRSNSRNNKNVHLTTANDTVNNNKLIEEENKTATENRTQTRKIISNNKIEDNIVNSNLIDAQSNHKQENVVSSKSTNATKVVQEKSVIVNTKKTNKIISSVTYYKKANTNNQQKVAEVKEEENVQVTLEGSAENNELNLLIGKAFYERVLSKQLQIQAIRIPLQMDLHRNIVSNKEEIVKKPQPFLSKLDIGFLVAADATTDGKNAARKLSTGFGILLSYPLSKKLSLTTGFAVAKKVYNADSTSYKVTYSLGSRYFLTDIDATCIVYEVPLQLNYLVAQKGKNSFYSSVGLSTYFMKKEDYIYTYLYYNNLVKYPYVFENANNHLFSILNLSAAYRRSINENLAYQIMPYAKIPLTGIGNGKVNLYSFGLGVSFHYTGKKK